MKLICFEAFVVGISSRDFAGHMNSLVRSQVLWSSHCILRVPAPLPQDSSQGLFAESRAFIHIRTLTEEVADRQVRKLCHSQSAALIWQYNALRWTGRVTAIFFWQNNYEWIFACSCLAVGPACNLVKLQPLKNLVKRLMEKTVNVLVQRTLQNAYSWYQAMDAWSYLTSHPDDLPGYAC